MHGSLQQNAALLERTRRSRRAEWSDVAMFTSVRPIPIQLRFRLGWMGPVSLGCAVRQRACLMVPLPAEVSADMLAQFAAAIAGWAPERRAL